MKKIMLLMMVFLLAVSIFAQSEDDFQVGLTADGKGVVIKKYIGKEAVVKIPATIQGMPVREIGEEAFYENAIITSVNIPQGVIKIGNEAFSGLYYKSKLTSISLPEGLIEIGDGAFSNCPLTSITFPQSLTILGTNAFCGTNLTSVTFSKNLRRIGSAVFSGCENLKTVTIPEGWIRIPNAGIAGMFQECTALTTISLPSTLKEIGEKTFYGCSALATIALPASITTIQYQAFAGCTALTTVTIPETVENISFDRGAFHLCSKLNLASQIALRRVGYTDDF